MAEGVATYAALTRDADTARAAGDPRTTGQLMADELVRRTSSTRTPTTHSAGRSVDLNLVMSHDDLLGTSDEEAHLAGFGPIPAELAREIVASALGEGGEIWLRRLHASPTTGELVAMDSRARLFPAGLARFIRLRDQFCRTPWCDAPIRHIDHAQSHETGGPTSANNGEGLCEACNYAKQAPRWGVRPGPDGSVTTTIPTGHTRTTRPPPVVTIRRREVPALSIDYVLTG